MKKGKEYYGLTLQVTEHLDTIECLIQEGTGNTIKTSNLTVKYFPLDKMKHVITKPISKDGYVRQFFKVKVAEGRKFEFYSVEETDELNSLFEKPDYFKDLDVSHLFDKNKE